MEIQAEEGKILEFQSKEGKSQILRISGGEEGGKRLGGEGNSPLSPREGEIWGKYWKKEGKKRGKRGEEEGKKEGNSLKKDGK